MIQMMNTTLSMFNQLKIMTRFSTQRECHLEISSPYSHRSSIENQRSVSKKQMKFNKNNRENLSIEHFSLNSYPSLRPKKNID